MEKITKRQMYETIIKAMEEGVIEADPAEVAEFCRKEIAQLDKKAEKAKERAAEKRAENDALLKTVEDVLSTEDYMPLADIVIAIGDEAITTHKVISRLSALIDQGRAEKKEIVVEDGDGKKSRKMGYKKIAEA